MRRSFRPALALLSLVLATLPALAGEVFTWKDAKGVTHYADAPPAGQKHSTRTLGERVPAAPRKAVVVADCSNARSNLNVLQGSGKVGFDADKDGKPERELTAAERAGRVRLAQRQVEQYCGGPIARAATVRQG